MITYGRLNLRTGVRIFEGIPNTGKVYDLWGIRSAPVEFYRRVRGHSHSGNDARPGDTMTRVIGGSLGAYNSTLRGRNLGRR